MLEGQAKALSTRTIV